MKATTNRKPNNKINIITLGCSKNIADSEHVAGHLRKSGFQVYFDRDRNDCDTVIVNTCGFIGDAKEESINALLEQIDVKKRGRRQRKIIAIGCLIERYRNELASELPEIDAFYGVHQWGELINSLESEYRESLESERMQSTPKHYAYLKISEGCNRQCSYCAIPLIRGKHVSRPIDDIVDEAKKMVSDGVKELILIAQDTTYYGLDLYGERRLGTLLERLSTESGAEWIRIHYTYPASFPDDAINAIAQHDNICKYIDIPLQHINSQLLKSMQRGVDKEETLRLIEKFRRSIPNVALRTTLIVGYPGESEEDFEELKEFVKTVKFNRLGVFAYSPEEGTAAYKLGDPVDDEEKQRRVEELMEIQEKISLENNESKIGRKYKVLIDRREGDYWVGRTEYDSPEVDDEVLIKNHPSLREGHFINVEIEEALEHDLIGKVI
ncbi:MAG: 30S ribosomal protein S12 methylthiotransferase RimO [Bacteroidales bacterium]|nr:30S ribosomal protein S12 methylthiotransferase RimO [Bacteroidales bacterium]